MVELNNKHWKEQNEDEILDELIKAITKATLNGDTLIYRPARQQHRMFYYYILYLFVNNYWTWCFNQTKIPITFKEFINNRSLSKYTQKASKEINYGNSNRNNNKH